MPNNKIKDSVDFMLEHNIFPETIVKELSDLYDRLKQFGNKEHIQMLVAAIDHGIGKFADIDINKCNYLLDLRNKITKAK